MNLIMYRHPNSIIDALGAGLYATLQLAPIGQGRSGYRVTVSVTGQNLPLEKFSPRSEFPRKISPPLVKTPPRTDIISEVQFVPSWTTYFQRLDLIATGQRYPRFL